MASPPLNGPKLYTQADLDAAEIHPFASGLAGVYSRTAPGRELNEDSAVLIPTGERSGVLAVADGAGGMPNGEEASRLALCTLAQVVTDALAAASEDEPSLLRAAILDGIERANQVVQDLGTGAGTTLAVAEVQDGHVRSYHVGDSLILVTGQRGRIKLQTVSHSPVGYAVEAGLLDEEQAVTHEERHVVSNLLGTPDMRIEIGSTLKLAPRDTLLIASDGLADNLFVEEIVERARKGSLARVSGALAEGARGRMERRDGAGPCHPDDLTFVVFRLR